ncbi:MAG: FAD-dependent oxidoreductase, partial [Bdellovibrionales bacterium]|nr:FAD-dependent oxidoreductase [Bdellovibrionales bacterium]
MKPIILVGGGVQHYHLIRDLKPEDVHHPIIMVAQNKRVFDRSKIPHIIQQQISVDQAYFDLWAACQRSGVYFLEDESLRINREEKVLKLKNYGQIGYERLSIECESDPLLPFIKGTQQNSLLSLGHEIEFISQVNEFLFEVEKHCPREVRVVISGSQFSSLQLALSIQSRLSQYCDHVEMVLITQEPTFFNLLGKWQQKALLKYLKTQGLRFMSGKAIEYVSGHDIYFTDQSQIDFDIFVASENMKPRKLISKILQTKSQSLLVNPDLTYYRDENLFIHGDCVQLSSEHGGHLLNDSAEQQDVLRKNLFREDIDDPKVDYRLKTHSLKQITLSPKKALKFVGPVAWPSDLAFEESKKKILAEIKEQNEMQIHEEVKNQVQADLEYETHHMSRPWKGSLGQQNNTQSQRKLISFNGFNWWGSYAHSAQVVTLLAILKALASGVSPELLRFNLTLPPKDGFWTQHIFESSFKAIEKVAETFSVELNGGDTFNGEHWHLSVTIGGEISFKVEPQFRKDDYVILSKPLGFGLLWAGRLDKHFQSEWLDKALENNYVPDQQKFFDFVKKWEPRGLGFVEEWGFI